MKQIRKWIALCLAVVILAGSFSGQTVAEAKSSKGKVTLKIGKTTYTKRTCQLVKGQKVTVKVKSSNLTGKKRVTYYHICVINIFRMFMLFVKTVKMC